MTKVGFLSNPRALSHFLAESHSATMCDGLAANINVGIQLLILYAVGTDNRSSPWLGTKTQRSWSCGFVGTLEEVCTSALFTFNVVNMLCCTLCGAIWLLCRRWAVCLLRIGFQNFLKLFTNLVFGRLRRVTQKFGCAFVSLGERYLQRGWPTKARHPAVFWPWLGH